MNTREKLIEEMIDVITDVDDNGYAYDSEGFEITGYANSKNIAEALYNAGYRKQSENMIEVIRCYDCKYCEVVIDSIIDEPKYFCTKMVGSIPIDPTDYCSRAKMKGGE